MKGKVGVVIQREFLTTSGVAAASAREDGAR